MKKGFLLILMTVMVSITSCAHYPPDRYNTQRGALIGAGAGALLGQAIGGNTGGTLIGLAAGTILGGLAGNAVDQDYQAAREAAQYQKQVIYYDRNGSAIEATPGPVDQKTNCRTVTNRVWKDGEIVSERVEEICQDPPPPPAVVVQPRYLYPAYPYSYPPYPGIYFNYQYRPYPRPYPYSRWHRW